MSLDAPSTVPDLDIDDPDLWTRFTYDGRWAGAHGIGRHAHEVSIRLPDAWTILRPGAFGTIPSSAREPLDLARHLRSQPAGSWFISPGYNAPFRGIGGASMVPTVHDLLHLRSPHRAGAAKVAYCRAHLFPALRRAPLVLTVSETSRVDLITEAGLDPRRVVVIGNGLSDSFARPETRPSSQGRDRRPTVVALSSEKHHKNLATILEALARPELHEATVVLVGSPNSVSAEHGARLAREGRLRFVTGLDDHDLANVIRSADAFLALSRLEGFDLPLIEAVAVTTPVVASDIPIHREVAAGLGGIRYAPADEADSIAAVVSGVLAHPPTDAQLQADATTVIDRYDWNRVTQRLLSALSEAAR